MSPQIFLAAPVFEIFRNTSSSQLFEVSVARATRPGCIDELSQPGRELVILTGEAGTGEGGEWHVHAWQGRALLTNVNKHSINVNYRGVGGLKTPFAVDADTARRGPEFAPSIIRARLAPTPVTFRLQEIYEQLHAVSASAAPASPARGAHTRSAPRTTPPNHPIRNCWHTQ